MKSCCLFKSLACALLLSICLVSGQTRNEPPKIVADIPVNYDEALVGSCTYLIRSYLLTVS